MKLLYLITKKFVHVSNLLPYVGSDIIYALACSSGKNLCQHTGRCHIIQIKKTKNLSELSVQLN